MVFQNSFAFAMKPYFWKGACVIKTTNPCSLDSRLEVIIFELGFNPQGIYNVG